MFLIIITYETLVICTQKKKSMTTINNKLSTRAVFFQERKSSKSTIFLSLLVQILLHNTEQRNTTFFHHLTEIFQHIDGILINDRKFFLSAFKQAGKKFTRSNRRRSRSCWHIFNARRINIVEDGLFNSMAQEVFTKRPLEEGGHLDVVPFPTSAGTTERSSIGVVAAHDTRREKSIFKSHVGQVQVLDRNTRLSGAMLTRERVEEAAASVRATARLILLLSRDEDTPPDGQLSVGVGVGDVLNQTISTVAGVGLDVEALQAVLEGDAIEGNISDTVDIRRGRNGADGVTNTQDLCGVLDKDVLSASVLTVLTKGFGAVGVIKVQNVGVTDDHSITTHVDTVSVEREGREVDFVMKHLVVFLLEIILIEDINRNIKVLDQNSKGREQSNVVVRSIGQDHGIHDEAIDNVGLDQHGTRSIITSLLVFFLPPRKTVAVHSTAVSDENDVIAVFEVDESDLVVARAVGPGAEVGVGAGEVSVELEGDVGVAREELGVGDHPEVQTSGDDDDTRSGGRSVGGIQSSQESLTVLESDFNGVGGGNCTVVDDVETIGFVADEDEVLLRSFFHLSTKPQRVFVMSIVGSFPVGGNQVVADDCKKEDATEEERFVHLLFYFFEKKLSVDVLYF